MANHGSKSGNSDGTVTHQEQRSDERLIKILNDLHTAHGDSPGLMGSRNKLVEWCENHLKENMKGIMFRAFGPQIANDGSLRFTVLWNDVLVKVLSSGNLEAREGDVIRSLTSYFSTALANQARDYLRRRKRFSNILDDAIKPLVEQRERYLQENYKIDFEFLLEKAEEWEKAGDKRGAVLRLRYVDGMKYEEIAEALGLSRDQVKHTLADGRQRLKSMMSN